jgi:hypothetical protein
MPALVSEDGAMMLSVRNFVEYNRVGADDSAIGDQDVDTDGSVAVCNAHARAPFDKLRASFVPQMLYHNQFSFQGLSVYQSVGLPVSG